jgi:hypothetical protein
MKVIFAFDTEDFVTPEAADAEKWWADSLTKRNLRGSFQCVAEVIRRLKTRGREDVIEALAKHEIGFHTQFHSMHPVHPPAVENLSLAEGIAWVLKREAAGLAVLVETFNRMPVSYCPPGDSWTPATLLAMAASGIKLFVGSEFPRPHWYCGLLGVKYDLAFESYFGEEDNAEEAFRRDFEALAQSAGPAGVIVLYSHPTRLVTFRFWDVPLFAGREIAMDDLPPAPLYPPAVAARNRARAERLLDWVRQYPGAEFIDFATLYARAADRRRDLPGLLQEAGLKPGAEGRLPLREEPMVSEEMRGFLDRFEYRWPLYPAGFTGANTKRQMRRLAWTLQPASGDE